jgi:hypothetical protein
MLAFGHRLTAAGGIDRGPPPGPFAANSSAQSSCQLFALRQIYADSRRHRHLRLTGAGLSQFGATVKVEGGDCELVVAVTAPLIPTTSLGKAPDLSLLQEDIAEALRRAFNRSRNRLPPDPSQPKPPKSTLPRPVKSPPFEPSGRLATRLAFEAEAAGVLPRDLLVLSPGHDPFNETKASRRDAE